MYAQVSVTVAPPVTDPEFASMFMNGEFAEENRPFFSSPATSAQADSDSARNVPSERGEAAVSLIVGEYATCDDEGVGRTNQRPCGATIGAVAPPSSLLIQSVLLRLQEATGGRLAFNSCVW